MIRLILSIFRLFIMYEPHGFICCNRILEILYFISFYVILKHYTGLKKQTLYNNVMPLNKQDKLASDDVITSAYLRKSAFSFFEVKDKT